MVTILVDTVKQASLYVAGPLARIPSTYEYRVLRGRSMGSIEPSFGESGILANGTCLITV